MIAWSDQQIQFRLPHRSGVAQLALDAPEGRVPLGSLRTYGPGDSVLDQVTKTNHVVITASGSRGSVSYDVPPDLIRREFEWDGRTFEALFAGIETGEYVIRGEVSPDGHSVEWITAENEWDLSWDIGGCTGGSSLEATDIIISGAEVPGEYRGYGPDLADRLTMRARTYCASGEGWSFSDFDPNDPDQPPRITIRFETYDDDV